MRKLIEYFVRYPILANIIIVVTVLAGIISFLNTKKTFFPTRAARSMAIDVTYPGASPQEMEEGVTLKVEEAINSIVGIEEIFSTSSENFASIRVYTLKGYDIDEVFTEVKNAVDRINSFPVDAEKPIIYKRKPESTTQWIGLTGDTDLLTLKSYAEDIKDDFLASGSISQVRISGVNDREISIEVSEENLSRYGLTFDQVANAVRVNNRDISAGSIKAKDEEIRIRSNAKETDAEYIGEIILRSNDDGTKLLLRDVASIKEQFADVPNTWTLNGKRAVYLQVLKLEEEDLQEISEYVLEYAENFNKEHPGLELNVAFNFMDTLAQRLSMLQKNGIIGLILVLVVLGIFLNIKLSAWVAWGIPSSFLGLFIVGTMLGLTINMISLFGMIVVIGILVDDGIVIAENIYAHFEKTGNRIKAAVDGTMEVAPAVLTSVTTTMVAFSPLLLLGGGFEFLKDMAIVVIVSLAFSLLEAFLVLPAHLASSWVLRKKEKKGWLREKIEAFIDFMRYRLYGGMLKYTMKYRLLSLGILFSLILITSGLFSGGFIKSTFFPRIPFDAFNINIVFKPGTREHQVKEYLERFEKTVWVVNDELKEKYNDTTDFVTFTLSGTGGTIDGEESGSHAGSVRVFYRDLDGTGINAIELVEIIKNKIGDIPEAEKFIVGETGRFGKPVEIRLLGKNMEELNAAKDFLKAELEALPELKEVKDNVAIGNREMLLDLKPEAYFLGLSHGDISTQIRQGFFGEEVQRLQKESDEVKVWVRYPGSGRLNVGQLEDMKIKTTDGQEYPLTELIDYKVERGISGIRHYQTSRAVTVDAEMVDFFAEVPPVMKKIRENILPRLEVDYPGVTIDLGGQSREAQRTINEMLLYFGTAFLVMVLLITLAFKSFYQALMVILIIPLGWMGAAWGHGIESWIRLISGEAAIPVSLLSVWGMVALSGVIINDAVVFLAKFNSNMREGQRTFDAAYNAGIARFRAIMLTSITTVAGLYPLIMEKSFQAQFLIPMAVSIAYGVFFGTFIILLFFPPIILLFNDVRYYLKWLWTGVKPSREEVERVIIDEKRNLVFDSMHQNVHGTNGNGHKPSYGYQHKKEEELVE